MSIESCGPKSCPSGLSCCRTFFVWYVAPGGWLVGRKTYAPDWMAPQNPYPYWYKVFSEKRGPHLSTAGPPLPIFWLLVCVFTIWAISPLYWDCTLANQLQVMSHIKSRMVGTLPIHPWLCTNNKGLKTCFFSVQDSLMSSYQLITFEKSSR